MKVICLFVCPVFSEFSAESKFHRCFIPKIPLCSLMAEQNPFCWILISIRHVLLHYWYCWYHCYCCVLPKILKSLMVIMCWCHCWIFILTLWIFGTWSSFPRWEGFTMEAGIVSTLGGRHEGDCTDFLWGGKNKVIDVWNLCFFHVKIDFIFHSHKVFQGSTRIKIGGVKFSMCCWILKHVFFWCFCWKDS